MRIGSSNPILKLVPFWIFVFLFKFGAGLHYTLMAPLGTRILPVWLIGLLVGATSFIQLVLDVPAGFILDRYGYRRFLKITSIVFLSAAVVMFFDFSITTFILTLTLSSFGWLFFGPGVSAYLLSSAPREYAGRIISVNDILGSAGIVFATAVLGLVLGLPVQFMGLIVIVIIVGALFALMFAPKDKASALAEKKHPAQHYYVRRHFIHHALAVLKRLNPAVGMLILLGLSASIFYATIWFVVPILLDSPESSSIPSVGLAIFDFSVMALGFLLGQLADKFNKRLLVLAGLLVFAVAGTGLGFSTSIWFVLLGFIATVGDELAGLTLWAWLDRIDKKHTEDGLLSGAITFFYDLGWTIGPIMGGFLFTRIGPQWTMTVGAIPVLITLIVSVFMVRPRLSSIASNEPVTPRPHRIRHKG